MRIRLLVPAAAVATALLCAALPAQATAPAAASGSNTLKNKPLSKVIKPYSKGWDKKWGNYNIVSHAAFAVLKANPDSDVAVLAKGRTKLTAFLPTDRAFQKLVTDLTGKTYKKERRVYKAVLKLGVPTIEQVLLYHVVPGVRITAARALKADEAILTTAQGGTIRVNVLSGPVIKLVDKAPAITNARVILSKTNINKGNKQIAHGVSRVLLPIPLTPKA
jgi:uncharacterized surface protein with fasciclin (FAS1) repeats